MTAHLASANQQFFILDISSVNVLSISYCRDFVWLDNTWQQTLLCLCQRKECQQTCSNFRMDSVLYLQLP